MENVYETIGLVALWIKIRLWVAAVGGAIAAAYILYFLIKLAVCRFRLRKKHGKNEPE